MENAGFKPASSDLQVGLLSSTMHQLFADTAKQNSDIAVGWENSVFEDQTTLFHIIGYQVRCSGLATKMQL